MIDLITLQKLSASALEERLDLSEPEKETVRRFAEKVFGSRTDVLQQPGPDPEEDRYLAMLRLLRIANAYGGFREVPLGYSEASLGSFFYVTEERLYASDCYDGGCGGIEEDSVGVRLRLDTGRFPTESMYHEVLAKLDGPAGLSDCVLIEEYRE